LSTPTLNIRCPSWSHLENFYNRKVKDGNVLLARVPFTPVNGSAITIALDLPDGLKVLIPGEVEAVKQAPDGRKSAIRMVLQGLDGAMRARLERAVSDGLAGEAPTSTEAPLRSKGTHTEDGLPLPIPADVPIDERVPLIELPEADEVPEVAREQYKLLEGTLKTLREKAAHDVLGVEWDADVATVRLAYFGLVKKYHPDVMARHASPEISLLSSELFIYINKAYDRLRDSAVAAGKAIAAGPALLAHDGWLADFDDLGALASDLKTQKPEPWTSTAGGAGPAAPGKGRRPEVKVAESRDSLDDKVLFNDARITHTGANPLGRDAAMAREEEPEEELDVDSMLQQSTALLEKKEYDEAREVLAILLQERPRNRTARALYHVSYGYTLLARKKSAEAQTQFEVALKHDPDCSQAKAARAAAPGGRRRRASLLDRILGR
jgi:tetratricopeptide (TPR) repeat protein